MDTSFPRLAQMILDYENPIKKMTEEFIPLSKVLVCLILLIESVLTISYPSSILFVFLPYLFFAWYLIFVPFLLPFPLPLQIILQAVMSLSKVYVSRNLTADQLRKQNVLSISSMPQAMLTPTLSGELPCEFLSLESMHRWILCKYIHAFKQLGVIHRWSTSFSSAPPPAFPSPLFFSLSLLPKVGFMLCYSQLGAPGASDIWKLVLQDGYVLTLHRDESLLVHSVFEKVLQDSRNKE